MFQSRKQILWGFLTSIIANELLAQYTWSGKSETGNKMSFKDLSHIQIVLFNAMMKVDCNYTLSQFEDDIKINLVKCSNMCKYLQQNKEETIIIIETEQPKNQAVAQNKEEMIIIIETEQPENQAVVSPSTSEVIVQTQTTTEGTQST